MRERKKAPSLEPSLRILAGFALVGGLLFIRVWWPIQAERNFTKLRKVETQIFQKKSELNVLNERYAALAALPVLDQWAKQHGPWKVPSAENVIAIQ